MDPLGILDKIIDSITSADLQKALFPLKIVLISVSVFLAILIIWFFKISSYKNFLFLDWLEDFSLLKRIRKKEKSKKEKKFIVEEKEIKGDIEKKPQESLSNFIAQQRKTMQKIETSDWQRILDKIDTKDELKCKLAILDAEKMLKKELEDRKREPETLKNFEDIEKVREYLEKLMDQPKKGITLKNAQKIIEVYQKALKEINNLTH
jgi:hypothetical protein